MGKNRDQRQEREEQEMSAQESRAFRAALAKPEHKTLTDEEKREEFRIFWAQAKSQYGKGRNLEEVLWLHLKAMKMDKPEQFEDGLNHFGLTKTK